MNEFTQTKEQIFLQKIKDGFFELCDDGIRNTKTKHVYTGRLVSIWDCGQVHTIGKSKLEYMVKNNCLVPNNKFVWKGKLRDCTLKQRTIIVDNTKLNKSQVTTLREKLANNVGLDLSIVAMNEGISPACVKRALAGIGQIYGAISNNVEYDIIGKVNLKNFRVGSIRSNNSRFTNKEANEVRERFLDSNLTIAQFLKLYQGDEEVVRKLLKHQTYVFSDDVCKKAQVKYNKMIMKNKK